jgi:ribosomal protein S18 acetylase RimI-like enzyme
MEQPARTIRLIEMTPLREGEQVICEAILRALPDWFGIESSLVQYVADAAHHPTWVAADLRRGSGVVVGAAAAGFLTIRRHFPEAAEIHCIAVRPEEHRRGVGRAMVAFVEDRLRRDGVRFLQVKTLGPSRPDEHYARTRRFYDAIGFTPLEEFPTLWGRNPALQMVKAL